MATLLPWPIQQLISHGCHAGFGAAEPFECSPNHFGSRPTEMQTQTEFRQIRICRSRGAWITLSICMVLMLLAKNTDDVMIVMQMRMTIMMIMMMMMKEEEDYCW